jgi:formylglycine-generating enzyme required for sulfatase activity
MTGTKSYRLLSEAEFEYAARAGTSTDYPWGNEIGKGNANCDGCGSQWDNQQTAPVGSFKANAFDLYDMQGNVWQWVEDCWHDTYEGAPRDGSAWETVCDEEGRRVIRGGSWNFIPEDLRAASRIGDTADFRYYFLGFRVALEPVLEKMLVRVGARLQSGRINAIDRHGVVSCLALQRQAIRG